MQNILIPTDFSTNAYHALRYATRLFKNNECTFYLLNVYGGTKGFKKIAEKVDYSQSVQLFEESQTKLKKTLGRIRKDEKNPKHSYELISKDDDLRHVVLSLIDEVPIDLIVMGNKGKKSSIPIFLGSTTTTTLQSVKKCPVLTVPKTAKFDMPQAIAFATDYKRPYGNKTLEVLRSMALHCDAKIGIVHIDEEERLDPQQQSNLDSLLAYLEPVGHSLHRMPNFISKTKLIQVFLEDLNADMLVMVSYEHGFLEKMLREPIIEKMVFNIEIPFLVIPATN